jgi:hypothetical protein
LSRWSFAIERFPDANNGQYPIANGQSGRASTALMAFNSRVLDAYAVFSYFHYSIPEGE